MEQLDQQDYYQRLEATAGPALVVFTSPACGACRHLLGVLADFEGAGRPRLFRVDASQNRGLVEELEFFHLPAMYLYVDGSYHSPVECEPRVEALLLELERRLAAPPEPEP